MKQNRPIFILGPPRSGTTWMWGLLESHPETVAFTSGNLGGNLTAFNADQIKTTETGMFNNGNAQRAARLIRKFQAEHSPLRVIEKSPTHSFAIPRIREAMPGCQFVIMQRDCRAIVASYLGTEMKRFRGYTVQSAVKEVAKYQKFLRRYGKGYPDCLHVKYENLAYNPFDELKTLLSSLRLSTEPIPEMIRANKEKVRAKIPGAFRKGDPEGWKKELTQDQIEYINKYLG